MEIMALASSSLPCPTRALSLWTSTIRIWSCAFSLEDCSGDPFTGVYFSSLPAASQFSQDEIFTSSKVQDWGQQLGGDRQHSTAPGELFYGQPQWGVTF